MEHDLFRMINMLSGYPESDSALPKISKYHPMYREMPYNSNVMSLQCQCDHFCETMINCSTEIAHLLLCWLHSVGWFLRFFYNNSHTS